MSDRPVYCPFAFGYSNYSRAAYAPAVLEFGALVKLEEKRLRSTLGGVGIALSRNCRDLKLALRYLAWISSSTAQKTVYFETV